MAVAFRKHACLNPNAVMQKPLTIADLSTRSLLPWHVSHEVKNSKTA